MTANILEELLLVRSPLKPVTIDFAAKHLTADRFLDTRVHLGCTNSSRPSAPVDLQGSKVHSTSGQLLLSVPMVVRRIAPPELGRYWADFCKVLQEHGIPICCAVGDLEPVDVGKLPLRIGSRHADHGFNRAELDNADAFELDCRHRDGRVWGWPSELGSSPDLQPIVLAARELLEIGTPLGVVLPTGAAKQDVCRALDSGADFITLVSSQSEAYDSLLVRSLAQIKELCLSRQLSTFPIMVDAPLTKISHVSTCLALGASLVAIDSLLRPLFANTNTPELAPVGSGMLSGIRAPSTLVVEPMAEIRARIQEILVHIRQQMQLCGALKLAEMNGNCLRALSEHAAKLTGVSQL